MSTVLADVISKGTHSGRPSAGVAGRLYYETDTALLFRDNGATWDQVAVNTAGSLEVKEVDGSPDVTGVTQIIVTNGTLTDNTGGSVTISTGGGGGGALAAHPMPLDSYAIDGTYGDDFTAATLDGAWTRRNLTSGEETQQLGKAATWMRVNFAGQPAGSGYLRPAPGGDWTFAMAFIYRPFANMALGLAVVDTNGTGLVAGWYGSPQGLLLEQLTTYTTYGGAFVQSPDPNSYPPGWWEGKEWMYLRKSGTNYYLNWSMDGELWGRESAAIVWAGTVDRIGMLVAPLTTPGNYTDIDWFNKIA